MEWKVLSALLCTYLTSLDSLSTTEYLTIRTLMFCICETFLLWPTSWREAQVHGLRSQKANHSS
ncbi:hypothetical protein CGMCC3_g12716 [Colletotrichum fructicola]|nr:uncharacterized protein CGMCC3_g12716 [Colletotrichum fructicola]KAE9571162.1 hypothetical protein CGMCC3_g12716 [Colletotrichum fructicola]